MREKHAEEMARKKKEMEEEPLKQKYFSKEDRERQTERVNSYKEYEFSKDSNFHHSKRNIN